MTPISLLRNIVETQRVVGRIASFRRFRSRRPFCLTLRKVTSMP